MNFLDLIKLRPHQHLILITISSTLLFIALWFPLRSSACQVFFVPFVEKVSTTTKLGCSRASSLSLSRAFMSLSNPAAANAPKLLLENMKRSKLSASQKAFCVAATADRRAENVCKLFILGWKSTLTSARQMSYPCCHSIPSTAEARLCNELHFLPRAVVVLTTRGEPSGAVMHSLCSISSA